MDWKRIISRSALYFRIGHGNYLHFVLGFAQWIIVLYTLYIVHSPLAYVFPRLSVFIITFLTVYPLLAVVVGYIHYKRSPMFRSEVEIGTEANPFNYRLVPGKETVLQPFHILSAELSLRVFKHFNLLSAEEEEAWKKYIQLLEYLAKGGDIRYFRGFEK